MSTFAKIFRVGLVASIPAVAFVLALCWRAYAQAPEEAMVTMTRAVMTRDHAALNNAVDFQALRTDLKAQITYKLMKSAGAGDNGAAMAVTLMGPLLDNMLNGFVSPEGFISKFTSEVDPVVIAANVDNNSERFAEAIARVRARVHPDPASDQSWTRAVLVLSPLPGDRPGMDPSAGTLYVFTRTGLFDHWRLTAMTLPP